MGLFDGNKIDFKSTVNKIQEKVVGITQEITDKLDNDSKNTESDLDNNFIFCSNCGKKLKKDVKFCYECGNQISVNYNSDKNSTEQSPQAQREQEYSGKILKCPGCGANITETTAICPDCGMRIIGKSAVSSVQNFKEQLMEIESGRKRKIGGLFADFSPVSKIDSRKLTLIKTFPVPNTVDDCLEFMLLAIANIDINLSKNTLTNRINSVNKTETGATIDKTISDAWVLKMQQIYKKAEILFPNDPAFEKIQKIYLEKMKELKIKV